MLIAREKEVVLGRGLKKWMHALVDAMSERITLLASLGYPLDKHLAVYRKMLDSALSNGQASTLSDTNTYKELAAKKWF